MSFETEESSGLVQFYTGTVTNPHFATDARYNQGVGLLLHWEMEDVVDEEGNALPDTTEMFSVGSGWESDDGQTAYHNTGKEGKLINKGSLYGKIIDRLGEDDFAGILPLLRSRGDEFNAGIWDGLRFEMERETFKYGKDIGDKTHIMPVKYIPTVAEPKTVKANPPGVATDSSGGLEGRLRTLAEQHPTHSEFLDAALEMDGVAENDELVDLISDPGFWEKANQ